MTSAAGWMTLALTLTVCIVGLKLTGRGYKDLRGALIQVQKDLAEVERGRLEAFLDESEADVLAALGEAAGDAASLQAIPAKHPLVAEPYLLAADGTIVTPLSGRGPSRPAMLDEPPAPPEIEKALRLASGPAPLAEKLAVLEDACRSEAAPAEWRIRAEVWIAGLLARSGEPARAAVRYEALFRNHETILMESSRESCRPSRLQLAVARAECLLAAGLPAEASSVVLAALEGLRDGPGSSTLEEERFFVRRAGEIFDRCGTPRPALLREIERAHVEARVSLAALETLRDWIFARRHLDGVASETGKPHHFIYDRLLDDRLIDERPIDERPPFDPAPGGEAASAGMEISGRRPIFAVWTRVPPVPSGPGLAAVGFLVNLERLEEVLSARLRSGTGEGRLAVRSAGAIEDGFLELSSLSAERSFIRIGLPGKVWDDLLGKARRPFLFAGALLVLLGMASVLGLLAFFRGVRREMALSRMKTEFVANVSHELKTPLSLIRLCGETLLLDRLGDPEKRKEYCRIINRESERLTHLISNVLGFATIEAGKKTYRFEPTDLGRAVRETYESYRFPLDEKGFTHRLEVRPDLPTVRADAEAVAQALINLLENAIKYSPSAKEIAIRVSAGPGAARVSVEDRGIGISADDQRRIWEDFYRTKEARTLGTRGSGLGLSLVQHIMKAHGGRVELESAAGEGSRFTLVFPVDSGHGKAQDKAGDSWRRS